MCRSGRCRRSPQCPEPAQRSKIAREDPARLAEPKIRDRNLVAIAEYHRNRAAALDESASIDDRTWDDLTLDSVFAAIDRTESSIGQQVLYHRLRSAPVADNLEAFDALTARMMSNLDERERAQIVLARLRDPAGYDLWALVQPGALETQPWHVSFPLIGGAVLAGLLLNPFWPGLWLVVVVLAPANLVLRVVSARRLASVLGAFRQVGPLLTAAAALSPLADGPWSAITGPLRAGLPRLARLRRYARWVGRDSAPAAAGDIASTALEYLNLLFLLDLNALYFAAREIKACGPSLLSVIAAVGEIDAAISVASFRAGCRWTTPEFDEPGKPAAFEGLRHPLIEHAVPNTIALAPPYGVLVTGSNMSGKTTLLRTLGVTVIMAQMIKTCIAESSHSPVLRVRSCIGRSDDLLQGKSYYLGKVEAVLELVAASARRDQHLLLFDELFRGTNAVERIAAGEAVLRHITRTDRHIAIAATHDGELLDLLRDRYRPFHFTDRLDADGLVFEYRLQPGPATTRNAIALLKLHGAPAGVVARALELASELDRQRGRPRK